MYLKFPFEYAQIRGLGLLFYPIVNLSLETVYGLRKFDFLVDTGADITTLSSDILPLLGLDKNKLKTSVTLGVGGIKVKTYEFKLPIVFGTEKLSISATAVDAKGNAIPFLLGRKDVFEKKFSLEIDSKNKATIIRSN